MIEDDKMDRSYTRAIELLRQRIRIRRSNTIAPLLPNLGPAPKVHGEAQLKGVPSIHGMKDWLLELGHSPEDLDRLNVIHVAGTKGKGSTCAFVDSFLRAHSKRTKFPSKTGLYTSPHLIYPEERIRINFKPLSRDLFAKYFFEVEDLLSKNSSTPRTDGRTQPRHLQLYTLLAFHTFIREGVNAAIIETHHGGAYDSTNVVEKPIVTCITSLGLDHMQQLGSSLESIAWHKAGIFKPGAMAISAPQRDEAVGMLTKRAEEQGVLLKFASEDASFPGDSDGMLKLDVMRINCQVARMAADSFLSRKAKDDEGTESCLSDQDVEEGIKQWKWPGRFQIEIEGNSEWYLDGAHNDLSVAKAAEWFIQNLERIEDDSLSTHILIFTQISNARDSAAVLECLAEALSGYLHHVIFTTYRQDSTSASIENESQFDIPQLHKDYTAIFQRAQPDTTVMIAPTVEEALNLARQLGSESGKGNTKTLITGSQHLVGPALAIIRPENRGQSA